MEVPENGDSNDIWIQYNTPENTTYYHNPKSNTTTWTKPQSGKIGVKQAPAPASLKKIPNSNWCIVLTNTEKEFYYDHMNNVSSWEIPDEIADTIQELIQLSMIDDDEPVSMPVEKVEVVKSKENEKEVFIKMLHELDISPYSFYENELSKFADDERYNVIGTLKEKKKLFDQYCKQKVKELQSNSKSNTKKDTPKEKERQDQKAQEEEALKKQRQEASLKERALKIQQERIQIQRKLHHQKSNISKDEIILDYQNFLIDNIKDLDIPFTTIEKTYTNSPRFQKIVSSLTPFDLHTHYDTHMKKLWTRKIKCIQDLLDRILEPEELFKIDWKDVWGMIRNDSKNLKLTTDEEDEGLEKWFESWRSARVNDAFDDFKLACKENTFITFHVKTAVQNAWVEKAGKESELNEEEIQEGISIGEIENVLQQDSRYLVLSSFPSKRDEILRERIHELIQQGMLEKGGVIDHTIAGKGKEAIKERKRERSASPDSRRRI